MMGVFVEFTSTVVGFGCLLMIIAEHLCHFAVKAVCAKMSLLSAMYYRCSERQDISLELTSCHKP